MSTAPQIESAPTYYVDPYPGRKGAERIVEDCGSCSGSGVYAGPSGLTFYTATTNSVAAGCFTCMGSGKRSFLVSSARNAARRAAKGRSHAEANAERWAIEAKNEARAQAGLIEQLQLLAGESSGKLGDSLWGYVYESQHATGERPVWSLEEADRARMFLKNYQAARATMKPAPVGKVDVEGKLLAVKSEDGFRPGSSVLKMLVECDGYKLWGTLPTSLYGTEYGAMIAFVATIEQSQGDESFGVFKRPTKARVISAD